MSVTYTSSTGVTVNVGSYSVGVTPGLQLDTAVDELDKLVGVSLTRTNTAALDLASNVVELVGSVPVIIPTSSTVATNGGITVTALPTTYSLGAWVYLPAGAVVGGSAGFYWVVFSSTTAGSVKTNYINPATTEFLPYIPTGTLVTAVGSNSAYTTPTGVDIALVNITLPANSVSPGSLLKTFSSVRCTNDADDKIIKHLLGSTSVTSQTFTTSTGGTLYGYIFARSNAKQVLGGFENSEVATTTYGTVDTTAASKIVITGQLTATTSYLVLEGLALSRTIN